MAKKDRRQQKGDWKDQLGKKFNREVPEETAKNNSDMILVWLKRTYDEYVTDKYNPHKKNKITRYILKGKDEQGNLLDELSLDFKYYEDKNFKDYLNYVKGGCFLYARFNEIEGNKIIYYLDNMPYRLPKDTRGLLESESSLYNGIENFAVKLNLAAQYEKDKFQLFLKNKGEVRVKPNFNKINFAQICERQETQVKTLYPNTHKKIELGIDWRMVIGLGGESIYETSMTLHHVYGIPYIPATSLKGVIRSAIIVEKFQSDEKKAERNKLFEYLFGSQEQRGKIVFFDAFPTNKPEIEADIMNVHYSDYYAGKKEATDDQNPIPIPFITVGKYIQGSKTEELKFQVIIGIDEKYNQMATTFGADYGSVIPEDNEILNEQSSVLDVAFEWLTEALTQKGIGAKTAVGYGYMQEG